MKKLLFLTILFLLINIITSCNNNNNEKYENNKLITGTELITTSTAKIILCATTQDNYKQLMELRITNDLPGVYEMIRRKTLFLLKTGTKIKIIQKTFYGIEIRVLEGEHKNKTGWLTEEFLKE